jgi:hypothetical protein
MRASGGILRKQIPHRRQTPICGELAVHRRALRMRLRFGMTPSFLFDGETTQRPRVKGCITQPLCTKKGERGEK